MPALTPTKDFRANIIYSVVTDRILSASDMQAGGEGRLGEVDTVAPSVSARAHELIQSGSLGDKPTTNSQLSLAKLRQYVGGTIGHCTQTLIPYLVKHNITALHLTPLFENYTAKASDQPYHGYWISDLGGVDPHFGTWADFQAFAKAAKANGISLILDVVLDHTNPRNAPGSSKQGLVKDHGKVLTTWEIDQKIEDEHQRYYANNGDMVGDDWRSTQAFQTKDMFSLCKWRYEENEKTPAEKYVFDNLKHWLRSGNFSGIRIDAFRHCPPFAVKRFVEEVRAEFGNIFIYGEWYGGGLGEPETTKLMRDYGDSLQFLDFPLQSVLEDSFVGHNSRNLATLAKHLTDRQNISRQQMQDIERQTWQPIFIDNHDMTRILSRLEASAEHKTERGQGFGLAPKHAAQIVEMYLTALMTVPGIPIIYYGTEQHFGSHQVNEVGHIGGDPLNREPMGQYEQTNLTRLIDRLGALRQHNLVMQRGLYQTLHADDHVLCFERFIGESQLGDSRKRGSIVMVGFNTGDAVCVELQGIALPDGFYRSVLGDDLNCTTVPHCRVSGHRTSILMPAGSMFVFSYNQNYLQGHTTDKLSASGAATTSVSSQLQPVNSQQTVLPKSQVLRAPGAVQPFKGELEVSFNQLELALGAWKDYPLRSESLNNYWQALTPDPTGGYNRQAAHYVALGKTRHLVPSLRTRDQELRRHVRAFLDEVDYKNTPDHLVELTLNLLVDVSTTYEDIPCLDALKRRLGNAKPALSAAVKTAKNRIRDSHRQTIVYVSVEARPWLGTGGLGNVMGELPRAIGEKGHNPVVIIPHHRQVVLPDSVQLETVCQFNVDIAADRHTCTVGFAEYKGVKTFLIANPYFFDREGPYSCYQNESAGDGAVRYDFFSRAVKVLMETEPFMSRVAEGGSRSARATRNPVDIVQLNDHHTAPLAYYLKNARDNCGSAHWADTHFIFAVHNNNPSYQGIYDMDNRSKVGFGNDAMVFRSGGAAEYYGQMDYLKFGEISGDAVAYVSRQFMLDAMTSKRGAGLEGVGIKIMHDGRAWGVLNGIDEKKWDPETDQHIKAHYSVESGVDAILRAKAENATDLREAVGLDQTRGPIFGMVARLVQEKGFAEAERMIPKILSEYPDAQFVFCGDGNTEVVEQLEALQQAYPDHIALKGFSEALERKIIAGATVMLVFSDYEPCGLPQIYSMRYGTVPWVHAVGGLDESVAGIKESGPNEWTGLKYKHKPEENLTQLLDWLAKSDAEKSIDMLRLMQEDFSWKNSVVPEYLSFYRHVHNERVQERRVKEQSSARVIPAYTLASQR